MEQKNLPTAPQEDTEERAVVRQASRLAAIPAVYRTSLERLACELALRVRPAEEIFPDYNYTAEQALELLESASFRNLLARIEKEVADNAVTFKMKTRAMAEDLLPEAYSIATDPLVGTATRVDVIQWMTRIAGLEPAKDREDKGGGGGLTLNISFVGQKAQAVVAHEPLTLEGDAT